MSLGGEAHSGHKNRQKIISCLIDINYYINKSVNIVYTGVYIVINLKLSQHLKK